MRPLLIGLSLLAPTTALAWPAPSNWLPVEQNGTAINDTNGDHRHEEPTLSSNLDIVGTPQNLALQWWADMEVLYIRLLLNSDPKTSSGDFSQGSWAIGFDLNGDTSDFEFAIAQNGQNYGTSFWWNAFAAPGVSANLQNLGTLQSSEGGTRVEAAGTNMGNDADWYLDFQVRWDYLQSQIAAAQTNDTLNPTDGFSIIAMTGEGFVENQFNVDLAGSDDSAGIGGVAAGLSDLMGWDSDEDQLSNAQELALGTDPYDADTDNDGISDFQEVDEYGTDPLMCDTDQDGLSDGLEKGKVTPLPDTDTSDGCFVKDEDLMTGSDPNLPDTDGGGAADGVEDWDGNGKESPFEGDLQDPSDDGDADNDGVPDFAEDGCELDNYSVDDADSDSDSLPDSVEGWEDLDQDGFPNFCDTDADGDGILDEDEGDDDPDEDGLPNWQDDDSDDDGIPDSEESPVGDADCDGIPDAYDSVYEDQCDDLNDTGVEGGKLGLTGGTYSGGACSSTGSSAPPWASILLMLGILSLRRRSGLLALLLPGVAYADTVEQEDVGLPVNAQRFRAASDSEFFTLEDGHIGPAAELGAALLFNHAANPLVYRYDDPDEPDRALLKSVSTAELAAWYNLPKLRLGAVLPLHVASSGWPSVQGFRLLGDARLFGTYSAFQSDQIRVSSTLDISLPTGKETSWLGDSSSVGELSVQAAYTTPKLLALAHLGYRLHLEEELLEDTLWGNRVTFGLGLAYRLNETTQISWENSAEFLSRTESGLSSKHTRPLESMAGVRVDVGGDLEVSAGAGAGLTAGVGSPDWRAIAGVHWKRSSGFASAPPPVVQPEGVPELPVVEPEPVIPTGWVRVIASNEGGLPVVCSVRVLGTGAPPVKGGADGWTELELPVGTHEVVVWAEGYQSFHTNIEVVSEGKTDIEVTLPGGKVAIEGDEVRVFEKIFFELDSTEIKRESFGILDEIVELLLNHPEITLMTIEGHTDDQGDAQYNVDLSFGRAEAVVHYLTAQGIERVRLQARGLGESRPILQGESEESRAANRRVEFHIRERLPEFQPENP